MGSAFHPFVPSEDDPERCAWRGTGVGECRRTEGSHQQDTRKGDRHKTKGGDRHIPTAKRTADRHQNRPAKASLPIVFFDTEGKDVVLPMGASKIRGPGRKLGERKCYIEGCELAVKHEGPHDSSNHRWYVEHRLIYGAAVDETGTVVLEIDGGGDEQPSPAVWLDALLEIGRRTKQRSIFSYGFGYDRTKMLQGLGSEILYMLTHREHRPVSEASQTDKKKVARPIPLYWNDFILDLQGTRFSVAKLRRHPDGRPMKDKKNRRMYDRMVVWDVLKFFQCAFTEALEAWRFKGELCRADPENVESKLYVPNDVLDEMRAMKLQRADFDKMPWDKVKTYCQGECKYGAQLVRELIAACAHGLGVKLRRFDGAGSISDALLQNHEVGQYMSAKNVACVYTTDSVKKRRLARAVMHAFAGGRFESTYCGVIRRPVYSKDICSAYPYAMYLHPCLAHGKWEHVQGGRGIDKIIETADLAVIRVDAKGGDNQTLGSFHHRDDVGNIRFPLDCKTWTWKPEYIAARDGMKDRIKVREAFVYRTDCACHPFKFMAELYLERLRIGKEGRGIAMKLGYNGCAGKTMQHVGSHRWQEYIWAGNTTSRTRAQLLWAISKFHDPEDVCYLATDSVFSLSDVPLDDPEPTNTETAAQYGKPPLGAWEAGKSVWDGIVIVRPGIAFPLNATKKQLKEIKARGISKSVLLDHTDRVIDLMSQQKKLGPKHESACSLTFTRRLFAGMKSCVHVSGKPKIYKTTPRYGQWYEEEITIKLSAQPKRFFRVPSEEGHLMPWREVETKTFPRGGESWPYDPTKKSAEARALEEIQDVILDQPNLDMAEFPSEVIDGDYISDTIE